MISIITSTYNRSHLVGKAIESVLSQTYKDWQYWITDDGSTDKTKKVVNRMGNQPSSGRLITEPLTDCGDDTWSATVIVVV